MFWSLTFWFLLALIAFKPKNFISILFLSELIWVNLYVLSLLFGAIFNDITLLSTTFYILGVAGLEFSIGILLSILYKNSNESINVNCNNKDNYLDNKFKPNINKLIIE